MKTYSAFVTLICLTLLASMLLMTKWKAPYTMDMTIYSHGLCYKYEYTEVWHTPKGDTLEYQREWTTIPLVWLWQWAWAWMKIKDTNWVWREEKHYMVSDIGMCMTYSFVGTSTETVFTSLYDHQEALNMLNGVVINDKIFEIK